MLNDEYSWCEIRGNMMERNKQLVTPIKNNMRKPFPYGLVTLRGDQYMHR